mmetsp:Transcript_33101/g.72583  ORF Transcript_33101/g.72583 Transcript_33101/m.72583 type:complete len:261 (+) Transcript_33101:111-893(+)
MPTAVDLLALANAIVGDATLGSFGSSRSLLDNLGSGGIALCLGMLQRGLTLLIRGSSQPKLDPAISIIRKQVPGALGTAMEGRPMQCVPPLLVGGGRIPTEGFALRQRLVGVRYANSRQYHARGPLTVGRLVVDSLFGKSREQGFDVGVGPGIPRIEEDILKAPLRFLLGSLLFGAASGGGGTGRHPNHDIARLVDDFVILGQFVAGLFAENLHRRDIGAETTPQQDGLGQCILHQVQRAHDGLDGKSDDHALVVVQPDG